MPFIFVNSTHLWPMDFLSRSQSVLALEVSKAPASTQNAAKKSASTSAVDGDDDDEPIHKILDLFNKEQLINLLR